MIDARGIAALIPHAGQMCLLDTVTGWDADAIQCATSSHQDLANPLRSEDRLSVVHALELAAQAVAVHIALLAPPRGNAARAARAGYLGGVRDVAFFVDRLDDITEPLDIEARRLFSSGAGSVYGVAVAAAGRPVAAGRLTVVAAAGGER